MTALCLHAHEEAGSRTNTDLDKREALQKLTPG